MKGLATCVRSSKLYKGVSRLLQSSMIGCTITSQSTPACQFSFRSQVFTIQAPYSLSKLDGMAYHSFSTSQSLLHVDVLIVTGTVPQPKPESKGRAGQRTIIHLDMDCFFASVAALTDPSLQDLPLLVCHSNSAQGTGEVLSSF